MPTAHHLSDALAALLKSRGLSYREVAAGVGIAHSNLSRLRDQRLESSKLRQLITWWSDDAARVQLMSAHLWDEVVRAGLDPTVFWNQIADEDGCWFASLPPKLQGALRGLGDTSKGDPQFVDLLDAMAFQRLRAAAVAHDAAIYPVSSSDTAIIAAQDAPRPRKNIGAPAVRPSLPPKPKAS